MKKIITYAIILLAIACQPKKATKSDVVDLIKAKQHKVDSLDRALERQIYATIDTSRAVGEYKEGETSKLYRKAKKELDSLNWELKKF